MSSQSSGSTERLSSSRPSPRAASAKRSSLPRIGGEPHALGPLGVLATDSVPWSPVNRTAGPRTVWLPWKRHGWSRRSPAATTPRGCSRRPRFGPARPLPGRHPRGAGLRIHDARRTYASHGFMNGVGLATVGKPLGHRRRATTAIDAHLDDEADGPGIGLSEPARPLPSTAWTANPGRWRTGAAEAPSLPRPRRDGWHRRPGWCPEHGARSHRRATNLTKIKYAKDINHVYQQYVVPNETGFGRVRPVSFHQRWWQYNDSWKDHWRGRPGAWRLGACCRIARGSTTGWPRGPLCAKWLESVCATPIGSARGHE